MPGKLPGGKLRISRVIPPLSTVEDPTDTEIKYFGLLRDEALDDIESGSEALKEILSDIQSIAERETDGVFNLKDVSVLDGIETFGVTKEDLLPLAGAAFSDGEGEAIVNPRQRIQDRITHFESFAGRGTPFNGSGPIKFLYYAPLEGTSLPGTVSIATNGNVTGNSTNFNGSSGTNDPVTPHVLSNGDHVRALNENNEIVGEFFVNTVTSKTAMTVTKNGTGAITQLSNVSLKVVYSHLNPPPFFTESITSSAFNAPDHIPSISQVELSHRIGATFTGSFLPTKFKEDWWEGDYERSFKNTGNTNAYQNDGVNAETTPDMNIIKDGNKNYDLLLTEFEGGANLGVRYDFYLKRNQSGEYFKWVVQKYGQVKIDIYKQTGITSGGEPQGAWLNVLDTTNENTYYISLDKGDKTDASLEFRERYVSGGPNFSAVADSTEEAFLDLRDTWTNLEDDEVSAFKNEYVPVVIRYWFGQDTLDKTLVDTDPDYRYKKERLTPSTGSSAAINIDFQGFTLAENVTSSTARITDLQANGTITGSSTSFLTTLEVGSRLTVNGQSYKVTAVTSNTQITVRNPDEITFSGQSYTFTTPEVNKKQFNNYYTHVKGSYDEPTNTIQLDGGYTGDGTQTTLSNLNSVFDIVAWGATAPGSLSATKNLANYKNEIVEYDFTPQIASFPKGTRKQPNPVTGEWSTNEFTVDNIDLQDNADVYFMVQNNPNMHQPPRVIPGNSSIFLSNTTGGTTLWQDYIFYPDEKNSYLKAEDLLSNSSRYTEIDPEKQSLQERSVYFGYKYGVLPEIKYYDSARYDGFIENKITTSNTQRDYDYSHDKLLAIGRQKKDPAIKPIQTGESRLDGGNYTFFMYEADEYNNGGRLQILAAPVNSLAAVISTATSGADGSGKILHSSDNVATFSNSNKQNIVAAVGLVEQGAPSDSYDIYQEELGGIPILVARASGTEGDYSALWSVDAMGASSRNTNDKTLFIASITHQSSDEAYFYELINAERPSVKASSVAVTGVSGNNASISSPSLFPTDIGDSSRPGNTASNNLPYIKSRVIFYNTNDEDFSAPLAEYEIDSYNASTTTVTMSYETGTGSGALSSNGNYRAIIYYNYLVLTEPLGGLGWTDENGIEKGAATLPSSYTFSTTNNNLYIKGVYNTSLVYSKVDNGSSLSFGDSLFVDGGDLGSALNPYSPQSELPFPPSGAVTPFGFDRGPGDAGSPGLGGICYPPIDTPATPALVSLGKEDSALYGGSNTVGDYDVYFGGRTLTNIGLKSLTVTNALLFDFPKDSYSDVVESYTAPSELQNLPRFSKTFNYTHKLKVELLPNIGEPNATFANATGLFARFEGYNNSGNANPYIYNDATTFYATLEPVKEVLYLFAKANQETPTTEVDINLLSITPINFV